MSSFCTAKATHIFFSKKFQHICVSLDVNFNESLTKDVVSFEQLGPVIFESKSGCCSELHYNLKIKDSNKTPMQMLVIGL